MNKASCFIKCTLYSICTVFLPSFFRIIHFKFALTSPFCLGCNVEGAVLHGVSTGH